MTRRLHGLLTERQLEVLRLRAEGLSQEEVAGRLKTTRENVTIIERRANRNVELARATLTALKSFGISASVVIKPGTHIVDIPRIILNKADEANIKVGANYLRIFEEVKSKAQDKVGQTRVAKSITVRILPDGNFLVE